MAIVFILVRKQGEEGGHRWNIEEEYFKLWQYVKWEEVWYKMFRK